MTCDTGRMRHLRIPPELRAGVRHMAYLRVHLGPRGLGAACLWCGLGLHWLSSGCTEPRQLRRGCDMHNTTHVGRQGRVNCAMLAA